MDNKSKVAASLAHRFHTELDYIDRFLGVVASTTLVDTFSLAELSERLHELSLLQPGESLFPMGSEPADESEKAAKYTRFTHEQLNEKRPLISELLERVTPLLKQAEENLLPPSERTDFYDPTGTSLTETVHFLRAVLSQEPDGQDATVIGSPSYDKYRQELVQSLALSHDGSTPTAGELANADKLISYAVEILQFNSRQFHRNSLFIVASELRQLDLLIHASEPDAYINVWRQSFISLMTAFDATVFDIVRVAFKKAFFTVLRAFVSYLSSDKAKLSLVTLSQYGSFDVLRAEMIDEHIESKYLRDLLIIHESLKADGVHGPDYPYLMEMVLRRNIHIHNRGRVDRKYLQGEGKDKGHGGFNMYKLVLGEIAEIDRNYLSDAMTRCENCIDSLSAWADSLVDSTSEHDPVI